LRLESVLVCVDYSDFLTECLWRLLPHVDDLIVVTNDTDESTKALCRRTGVRYVETEAFYAQGAKFNKSAGLNVGLAACKLDDWVLVIDADLALPPHTRAALERAKLDPRKIYGIDRVTALGRPAWDAVKSMKQLVGPIVMAPPLRLGGRFALDEFDGYVPAGYFQLWRPRRAGVFGYAIHPSGTCEGSDVLHALRWDRPDRVLLPEIIGIHLETSSHANASVVGANWGGRRTPAFA
jgi:glycosyltransferase involved in cell wall biosynthesis